MVTGGQWGEQKGVGQQNDVKQLLLQTAKEWHHSSSTCCPKLLSCNLIRIPSLSTTLLSIVLLTSSPVKSDKCLHLPLTLFVFHLLLLLLMSHPPSCSFSLHFPCFFLRWHFLWWTFAFPTAAAAACQRMPLYYSSCHSALHLSLQKSPFILTNTNCITFLSLRITAFTPSWFHNPSIATQSL